jgi:hypothetical protein
MLGYLISEDSSLSYYSPPGLLHVSIFILSRSFANSVHAQPQHSATQRRR